MTEGPRLSRPRGPFPSPAPSPDAKAQIALAAAVRLDPRPGLCLNEGVLSLFSLICCSYGCSTYKQE
jgi:hypothetical protein